MWLCVDVEATLSVTVLHSEEDVGHTHLKRGGEREEDVFSCVDKSHITLLPGVCVCEFFSQLCSAGRRIEHQGLLDRHSLTFPRDSHNYLDYQNIFY